MEIKIKIKDIIKNKQISKISNGGNIFNMMLSKYKRSENVEKFILDAENIQNITTSVFREIIRQMQTRLNGHFKLELVNANQIIAQQFKLALK